MNTTLDILNNPNESMENDFVIVNLITEEVTWKPGKYNPKMDKNIDYWLAERREIKRRSEIETMVNSKIRSWKMDSGAMSSMIDDMPEEEYDKVIRGFRKEAVAELSKRVVRRKTYVYDIDLFCGSCEDATEINPENGLCRECDNY